MDQTEITAGAVHLRPPRPADLAAITAACQDPLIARWTRVPSPYGQADAEQYLARSDAAWREGNGANFVVLDSVTEQLLGTTALLRIADGEAEVGYWLAADARGRGIGARAVAALCRWGFGALALDRIVWHAEVGNVASRRLAERVGFRHEGTLRRGLVKRGRRVDGWQASLLADDPPGR